VRGARKVQRRRRYRARAAGGRAAAHVFRELLEIPVPQAASALGACPGLAPRNFVFAPLLS
jgi:hypothetical protein